MLWLNFLEIEQKIKTWEAFKTGWGQLGNLFVEKGPWKPLPYFLDFDFTSGSSRATLWKL